MCFCKTVTSLSTQFGWCAPGSFHRQAPASYVSYPPALTTIHLLPFSLLPGLTLLSVPNPSRSQFVLFVPPLLHPVASLAATTASAESSGFYIVFQMRHCFRILLRGYFTQGFSVPQCRFCWFALFCDCQEGMSILCFYRSLCTASGFGEVLHHHSY